jgi:hypothetical protein
LLRGVIVDECMPDADSSYTRPTQRGAGES